MEDLITVHWCGFKRDSGRGQVWGYFTPKNVELRILNRWEDRPPVECCVFRGKIGKSLYLEDADYTTVFQQEVSTRMKNYKTIDPAKILPNWTAFKEEMRLYMLFRKLSVNE